MSTVLVGKLVSMNHPEQKGRIKLLIATYIESILKELNEKFPQCKAKLCGSFYLAQHLKGEIAPIMWNVNSEIDVRISTVSTDVVIPINTYLFNSINNISSEKVNILVYPKQTANNCWGYNFLLNGNVILNIYYFNEVPTDKKESVTEYLTSKILTLGKNGIDYKKFSKQLAIINLAKEKNMLLDNPIHIFDNSIYQERSALLDASLWILDKGERIEQSKSSEKQTENLIEILQKKKNFLTDKLIFLKEHSKKIKELEDIINIFRKNNKPILNFFHYPEKINFIIIGYLQEEKKFTEKITYPNDVIKKRAEKKLLKEKKKTKKYQELSEKALSVNKTISTELEELKKQFEIIKKNNALLLEQNEALKKKVDSKQSEKKDKDLKNAKKEKAMLQEKYDQMVIDMNNQIKEEKKKNEIIERNHGFALESVSNYRESAVKYELELRRAEKQMTNSRNSFMAELKEQHNKHQLAITHVNVMYCKYMKLVDNLIESIGTSTIACSEKTKVEFMDQKNFEKFIETDSKLNDERKSFAFIIIDAFVAMWEHNISVSWKVHFNKIKEYSESFIENSKIVRTENPNNKVSPDNLENAGKEIIDKTKSDSVNEKYENVNGVD